MPSLKDLGCKLFGGKSSKDIKVLRQTIECINREIVAVGERDPRRLARLASKNVAVSWLVYDTEGRQNTEILDSLIAIGRQAAVRWRTLDNLSVVDAHIYHALLLILAEAYLEWYVKTSGVDVSLREHALDLYARFLREDNSSDPAVDWHALESDDLTYTLDGMTAGGCISAEARRMNLDMARRIYLDDFKRLRVRDVRRKVREGYGTIRLRLNIIEE